MLLTIPETCECKYLHYAPIPQKDGTVQDAWLCMMCGNEFDVLAIRQRMLEGREVNELETTGKVSDGD